MHSKFWSSSAGSSASSNSGGSPARNVELVDDDDVDSGTESNLSESSAPRTPDVHVRGELSLDPDWAWTTIKSEQIFVDPPRESEQLLTGSSYTRFVCMSDTHGKHREVGVPKGDVLIHGGDFTKSGETDTVQDLSLFFQELEFEHIVCIAGNHELTFQPEHYDRVWKSFHGRVPFDSEATRSSLTNCTYLEDASCTVRGIGIYGSPWQPFFFDWAFNLDRGKELRDVWAQIPSSTDVLITHGPPLGRGDICHHGGRVGCYDLLQEVQQRVRPRLHVFGHVHEGYGVSSDGTTLFVNASNLTSSYEASHPCIVVDLPHDISRPAIWVQPVCRMSGCDFLRWLKANQYDSLVSYMQDASLEKVPTGGHLLKDTAYFQISENLMLHRDKKALQELRMALSKLYAESFEDYTPTKVEE